MSNDIVKDTQPATKPHKAYHALRLTDFGPVNELTRSGSYVLDAGDLELVRAPDGFIPNY